MSFRAAALLVLILGGCASLPGSQGKGERYRLDRVYFGRAIGDTAVVSDSAWAVFVRDVVTPRLPDGMTTWRGEGQWRSASGTVVREPSMVMEIIHLADDGTESALEAIIVEYKRRFHQEAVLRVTTDVRARF